MERAAALLVILLASVVLAVPSAMAQADDHAHDHDDPNTVHACEEDHSVPAMQAVCPITVALHMRGIGVAAEYSVWGYFALVGIALVGWLLIVLWRILPRRYIRIAAQDKIAEVAAGNPATYVITLENRRNRRPVEVEVAVSKPPKGWSASLAVEKPLPSGFKELLGEDEAMRVPLSARKIGSNTAEIKVTVTTPEGGSPEEWAELDVTAIPFIKDEPRVRRGKDQRIVTLIKARESQPAITSVSHEPTAFRIHDQVTTTVIVQNRGDGEVADLPVALHVNDEEVAREEVTIPAGGEACIEFPWTAESTQSRVRVTLGD